MPTAHKVKHGCLNEWTNVRVTVGPKYFPMDACAGAVAAAQEAQAVTTRGGRKGPEQSCGGRHLLGQVVSRRKIGCREKRKTASISPSLGTLFLFFRTLSVRTTNFGFRVTCLSCPLFRRFGNSTAVGGAPISRFPSQFTTEEAPKIGLC